MAILGLDIGGANLKAADQTGRATSRAFPIWRYPERLEVELAAILGEFPLTRQIAVTMTAELADCFSTKSQGVRFILEAVRSALNRVLRLPENQSQFNAGVAGEPILVWSTNGYFVQPARACAHVRDVAAANWHALTTWCGRLSSPGPSLLVDVGTTTTDIIPLAAGRPNPVGFTDVTRLQSGELCYSGVWRTPLCAVAHSVPFRNGYCSLAAELFATTLDVYLLLDLIAEDETNLDTSNGKPATKFAAHDRIARMLCCDRDELAFDEARDIAKFFADVQRQRLAGALERVVQRTPAPCESVILSGSGEFLARKLVAENRHTANAKVISLTDELSSEIAEAACAYAVVQLAQNRNLRGGD